MLPKLTQGENVGQNFCRDFSEGQMGKGLGLVERRQNVHTKNHLDWCNSNNDGVESIRKCRFS